MISPSIVLAPMAFFGHLSISFKSFIDGNSNSLLKSSRRGSRLLRSLGSVAAALVLPGALCVAAQAQTLQPNWIQQSPATSPLARDFQGLTYDAAHGQAVLFGGFGAGGYMNDTWLWNGSTWTQANPATSPSGRSAFGMTYDAAHGEVVLFGGRLTANSWTADTWLWNGTTWTQASPATSPAARSNMVMTYDATHGNVVLFGGLVGGAASNDTWIWNGTTWTQQAPSTSPSARSTYSMAYDAARGQVVLFGGLNSGGSSLNDTWVWSGSTWVPESVSSPPSARYGQSMDYDAALGETIMFGGSGASGMLGDTWAWNGVNWTQLTPQASPGAREAANGMVYDPAQHQLLLFGGLNASTSTNDTWEFGPPQNFGNINVCPTGQNTPAPCSNTLTMTYGFTSTTTIGSIKVVTQGASGLDFQYGGSDTCSGNTFSSGQSCTVAVAFTPTAPGLRLGAVDLLHNGSVVETQLIYGIGHGPAISFNPATQVSVNVQGNFLLGPDAVAVDAAGDVFISDANNGQIVEVAANGGNTSTIGGISSPEGLALDGAGDLFVAAAGATDKVIEFPAGCTNINSCASVVYNPGGNSSPANVAVDAVGDLFIADVGLHEVVEIPAGGGTQTVVYPASPNSNSVPGGVAVDAAGDLFVADSGLKTVVELPAGGGAQIPFGGLWISPTSVAVDAAGDVYVTDNGLTEAVWR